MTETPPRRDTLIEKTLTYQLLVAVNRIAQPFAQTFGQQFDLTLPDWRCMMALAAEPDISGEDVARKLAMDKMAVSRSMRRLEKRDFVRRRADAENVRRYQWRLTPAGWEVFDIIGPAALARDRDAFAGLTPEVREAVLKALSSFLRDDVADR